MGGCCGEGSPIVLDLQGDGFSLTSAEGGVVFDIVGDGRLRRISWTSAQTDDGLALDRNGNKVIDNGTELFGNFAPQPEKASPRHGFHALAVYDVQANGGNGDGWITGDDSIYASLVLWQDRNHNGVCEPHELFALAQVGVTGISLDYKESRRADRYGNRFRYRSHITRTEKGVG
jgi:hypothetical protein